MGKEVIILNKEGTINTAKVTRAQQSNYWRVIREDKVMKLQQQGISITNQDSVNPYKILIPENYNNNMELKKLKSKK